MNYPTVNVDAAAQKLNRLHGGDREESAVGGRQRVPGAAPPDGGPEPCRRSPADHRQVVEAATTSVEQAQGAGSGDFLADNAQPAS